MVRRMLSDVLGQDDGIEVVGHAIDGKFALQKIRELDPDLVTMDIEMPGQNGLQTLDELRAARIKVPVIMFSTLTDRGASSTLDALAKGACDYVCKPSNKGSVDEVVRSIHRELVPKIKAAVGRKVGAKLTGLVATARPSLLNARRPAAAGAGPERPEAPRNVARKIAPSSRLELLTIGISTGGPNALNEFLPKLPADFPAPILIVQHMPPVFTRLLAERLDAKCALSVSEAKGGERPAPGQVLIAPGDHHMVVMPDRTGCSIKLTQDPPENSCRPAVDPLFRTAAQIYGNRMLALVMTGMGSDGFEGCKAVIAGGGEIWAQDEASSVVWGMPGFVTNAGLVDRIVALDRMAVEVIARFPSRAATRPLAGKA